MGLAIMEERPRWLAILRYLDEHGARGTTGFRVDRETFAKAIGADPAQLGKYLKQMERQGVVRVQRTTVDGAFGSPRGYNRYFLLCTLERWETVLGPAIIAERRAQILNQRTVINRNTVREQKRKRELEKKRQLAKELGLVEPTSRRAPAEVREAALNGGQAPPAPVGPTEEEIEALAARYDDADDAELIGW